MDQRRANLLAEAMPAIVPVGRAFIQYYMEERQIDKRTEAQQEIIEARQEAQQHRQPEPREPQPASPSPATDTGRGDTGPEMGPLDEKIDSLVASETCSTCSAALRGIKGEPRDVQERGIDEYHELKRVAKRSDGPGEVSDYLESTDVIGDAMGSAVA